MLKHKDGLLINTGGGVTDRGAEGYLIRGTVEWERLDDGRSVITYQGQRYESTPEKPLASTGIASTVDPVDWDGDGDYDLIIGTIDGEVYLVPNEGTATAFAFGKEVLLQADGKPLSVASRAGPCTADWDGDGDLDLLVGADDGTVTLFRNTGSATNVRLAAGKQIVAPGRTRVNGEVPREPVRGTRAKICVADWNGDGKPDLLLGDLAMLQAKLPDPTPEQAAEYARLRQEMETVQQQYVELIQKLSGPSRVRDQAQLRNVERELSTVAQRMSEIQSQLPSESETHGWVWLFLRK
jgi:hypothetical protein